MTTAYANDYFDAPQASAQPVMVQGVHPAASRAWARWMLWRGRFQGVALALLLIFFGRWFLMVAAAVLVVAGLSRLLGFGRRRRRRRARRLAQHRAAQAAAAHQYQAAQPLVQRVPVKPVEEDPVDARLKEHRRAMDDFDRRLEAATGHTVSEPREVKVSA